MFQNYFSSFLCPAILKVRNLYDFSHTPFKLSTTTQAAVDGDSAIVYELILISQSIRRHCCSRKLS